MVPWIIYCDCSIQHSKFYVTEKFSIKCYIFFFFYDLYKNVLRVTSHYLLILKLHKYMKFQLKNILVLSFLVSITFELCLLVHHFYVAPMSAEFEKIFSHYSVWTLILTKCKTYTKCLISYFSFSILGWWKIKL